MPGERAGLCNWYFSTHWEMQTEWRLYFNDSLREPKAAQMARQIWRSMVGQTKTPRAPPVQLRPLSRRLISFDPCFLLINLLRPQLFHVKITFQLRDVSPEAGTDVMLELAGLDIGLKHLVELFQRAILGLRDHEENPDDSHNREGTVDKCHRAAKAALNIWIDKVDGHGRDKAAHRGEKQRSLTQLASAHLGSHNPASRAPAESIDAVPEDEHGRRSVGNRWSVAGRLTGRCRDASSYHGSGHTNRPPRQRATSSDLVKGDECDDVHGKAATSDNDIGTERIWEAELLHKRDNEVLNEGDTLSLLENLHAHCDDCAAQVGAAEAICNGRGGVELALLLNLRFQKLNLLGHALGMVGQGTEDLFCLVEATFIY